MRKIAGKFAAAIEENANNSEFLRRTVTEVQVHFNCSSLFLLNSVFCISFSFIHSYFMHCNSKYAFDSSFFCAYLLKFPHKYGLFHVLRGHGPLVAPAAVLQIEGSPSRRQFSKSGRDPNPLRKIHQKREIFSQNAYFVTKHREVL